MIFFQEVNIALKTTWLFAPFFFILGACLASFFNVVVFRYPKMLDSGNAIEIKEWLEDKEIAYPKEIDKYMSTINLATPGSHCYSCNNKLKWYQNIPVFSYIFLGGRCGFCKTPYSIQYPIVEFFGGIIMLMTYLLFFPKFQTEGLILASYFFMISYLLLLIDMKTMFLPDTINYSLMWIGIIGSMLSVKIMNITLTESLWGAVIGYMILWVISTIGKKIKGVEVMGGGDLKLVASIGVFVGVPGAIFTIFFSPFIGIFFWVYNKLVIKNDNPQFPYGPSLIIASWTYIFYGKEIFKYLNLPI